MLVSRVVIPVVVAVALAGALVTTAVRSVLGAKPEGRHPAHPSYVDPAHADKDFQYQGEFAGKNNSGEQIGVQVIALGNGAFRAVRYAGGLPGDGWDGKAPAEYEGTVKDGVITLPKDDVTGKIHADRIDFTNKEGSKIGSIAKVHRESPTMGKAAPAGAVVLFDGKGTEKFDEKTRMSSDNLLMQGARTKDNYHDFDMHMEFRLPYHPFDRGQARGNSGIYLQGLYEVQILDSFGLKGEWDECGGIYKVARPKVNMCYPPLVWQTYDIDFTEAKWNGSHKTKNAHVKVLHNGVLIQDTDLPHQTDGSDPKKEAPGLGPIYLQDHHNQMRFRNVWLAPKG